MAETLTSLKRELGLFDAVMLGLGSILGTGVFVSIAIGVGIAGPGVVLAIAMAGCVATCNALSSAQLAASHPKAGGTYEYGYTYLTPALGFTAGWTFLIAKSASAATAALGFAAYLASLLIVDDARRLPIALAAVVVLTVLVLSGLRRSSTTNIVIVSVTIVSLLWFIIAMMPRAGGFNEITQTSGPNLLHATALMFVAYTGYGRIATLGEEVKDPARTIPRAIIVTLVVSALLYIGVAATGHRALGGGAAALADALRGRGAWVMTIGAVAAMLGVLLNLILGLSRVLLAMGRRRDMPAQTANLRVAIVVVGAIIAALVCIGDVKTTWSFSAFTVLIYYAITNLACLRLPREHRLYPRAFAWCGLVACAGLAFMVERDVWVIGLSLIALGLIWHAMAVLKASTPPDRTDAAPGPPAE